MPPPLRGKLHVFVEGRTCDSGRATAHVPPCASSEPNGRPTAGRLLEGAREARGWRVATLLRGFGERARQFHPEHAAVALLALHHHLAAQEFDTALDERETHAHAVVATSGVAAAIAHLVSGDEASHGLVELNSD